MKSHAIRTARVPRRLSHPRATRALEHWLAGADPARHGLPAQAIVLVRRLQAPWTALASPEAGTRYGTFASALAGAARPARGELHGDVVWFADEAELLACLARAALAGELALHWWWKLVLRERTPEAARARWLEAAPSVPRAVARLQASTTRRWLATWTQAEQRRLVQGLAHVFPLADEAVLEELAVAQAAVPRSVHTVPGDASADVAAAPVVVAASEGLQRVLLALAHEPLATSDAVRVRALWYDGMPPMTAMQAAPVARTPAAPTSIAWRAAVRAADAPAAPAPAIASCESTSHTPPTSTSATPVPAARSTQAEAPASRPDEVQAAAFAEGARPAELPWPEVPSPVFLHTVFGGVLFLLNAALQLGLYGDFTQPRRPRTLDCSPWRFLLACGRLYAGRAFADDPLAAWLRERAPERAAAVRTRHPGVFHSLRERLAQALAVEDTRDLVPALLRLPARIDDGGERLDLHMDLACLPLPVRFAGLDRDPGWIPSAGCDVRFHFH